MADAGAASTAHTRLAVAGRPTGTPLILSGWLGIVAAAVLAVCAIPSSSGRVDLADLSAIPRSMILLNLAGDALWAGFFLLLAGCIVRAIWFLPGDGTKQAP
jgi:hypothetical protein